MNIIDYSDSSNLIIPSGFIPPSCITETSEGCLAVNIHGRLYVASEKADIEPMQYIDEESVSSCIFPSSKGTYRILMYRTSENAPSPDSNPDVREIALFYNRFTPWETETEYLEFLKEKGEYFFTVCDKREIVSAAYTTKGRRQLNCLFTRKDHRSGGLASSVLERTGSIHLFIDDTSLIPFYTDRGFTIIRRYAIIRKEKENEIRKLLHR